MARANLGKLCHNNWHNREASNKILEVQGRMRASTLSHVRLCDAMDCGPPGSSVHGSLQARILEWVAVSSSRGSSWPRGRTCVSCVGRWILYRCATGAPHREGGRTLTFFGAAAVGRVVSPPWPRLLAFSWGRVSPREAFGSVRAVFDPRDWWVSPAHTGQMPRRSLNITWCTGQLFTART